MLRQCRATHAALVVGLSLGIGTLAGAHEFARKAILAPSSPYRDAGALVLLPHASNYISLRTLSEAGLPLQLAGRLRAQMAWGDASGGRRLQVECVTPTYFTVLGVVPKHGRSLGSGDDDPSGAPAVVLSEAFAATVGEAGTLGSVIDLGGRSRTVVGVLPRSVTGLDGRRIDAWLPLRHAARECSFSGRSLLGLDVGGWLEVFGRPDPGVPLREAESRVRDVSRDLLVSHGAASRPYLEPLGTWSLDERRASATVVRALLASAIGIVALAAVNALLLFSLDGVRQRRHAHIRMFLGATPGHLIGRLALHGGALAVGAGVAAVPVAVFVFDFLSTRFAEEMPVETGGITLLWRVCGWTLVIALAALVPAGWLVWRNWTTSTGATVPGAGRWSRGLITVQVAVAIALLHTTIVLGRSVADTTQQPGFDSRQVVVVTGTTAPLDVASSLRSVGVVEATAVSTSAPLGAGQFDVVVASSRRDQLQILVSHVSPNYFSVVGTPLVEGVPFTEGRMDQMVVDRRLAGRLWPGQPVVGTCQVVAEGEPCRVVVGLTEPRRYQSPFRWVGEVFLPYVPLMAPPPQAVLVKTKTSAQDAVGAIIQVVGTAERGVQVRTIGQLLAGHATSLRVASDLVNILTLAAVLLSTFGTYAVLSAAVAAARRDLAIRVALGASSPWVVRAAVGSMVPAAALGWAGGIAGAWWLHGIMDHQLPGFSAMTTVTIAMALGTLAVSGLAGAFRPTLSALRADPIADLR